MKKLLFLIIMILLLVGCSQEVTEIPESDNSRFNGVTSMTVVIDSETGCKYIYIDKGLLDNRVVAISPLMKNKTEVDCGQ